MNKYRQSNWDGLTGMLSILFGLGYGGYAYLLPKPMFGNPWEPIVMPLAIATLMIVIGVLLMIKGRITPSIMALKAVFADYAQHRVYFYRIILTAIISLIYAAIFEHAGFIISTIIFMFMMLTVTCGITRWKRSLFIAALFSISIYFIFDELLAINLPSLTLFS